MKNYIRSYIDEAIAEMPMEALLSLRSDTLSEIVEEVRSAVADNSLDDFQCVEKITAVLEKIRLRLQLTA